MMLLYLLTDINRAKFLLEEFSNNEVIDEYLIFIHCSSIHTFFMRNNIFYNIFNFT